MVGSHTHKHSLYEGITHLLAWHVLMTYSIFIYCPRHFPQTESQGFISLRKGIYQMLLFFSRSRFYSVCYLFYIYLVSIDSR